MGTDNTVAVLFELIRAGLWEKDVELRNYGTTDFSEIMRLAEEQSVVGLVTAGLDHVKDVTIPQEWTLQFIGSALQIEQRNKAMNTFIPVLMKRLKENGVDAVLIKGQGVGQCYERPLWRSSGDIDLLMDLENYERGKAYLKEKSTTPVEEFDYNKEFISTIGEWCVELHGSLRAGLSSRMNRGMDAVQREICNEGKVRVWDDGGHDVMLPEVNRDVLQIFTHFLKHFYRGGLGVRQICDWYRLLFCYREKLDLRFLESRIRQMGLMSEWKAFAAYAVEYLGMPVEAMPLINDNDNANEKLKRKAERICEFVMKVGNFGQNRDKSYFSKYPFLIRKTISMGRRVGDLFRHARIFPKNTLRFLPTTLFAGLWSAVRGE